MRQGRRKCLFKEDLVEQPYWQRSPINSVQSVKKGTPDVHYADRIITILLHFNLPFSRSQTGPVIESISLLDLYPLVDGPRGSVLIGG